MIILDPGHIYKHEHGTLTFIKRSGGAVTYEKGWPGIQTQVVMRALIQHIQLLEDDPNHVGNYELWQLGDPELFILTLYGFEHTEEIVDIILDRSLYLNRIIPCIETKDAVVRLERVKTLIDLVYDEDFCEYSVCEHIVEEIREALWNYEARAWRRKVEGVNRKEPTHDDTARLRSWRNLPADDVPFSAFEIELRPIGDDGHIVLDKPT